MPRSKFVWPEMAQSKITGKLAIYIPPDKLSMVYKGNGHKPILIGKGISEMAQRAAAAVFNSTIILENAPSDEYLKANDFRGLLVLDSIIVDLILSDTLQNKEMEGQKKAEVGMRIKAVFTASDFLIPNNGPRPVAPDNQVTKYIKEGDKTSTDEIIQDVASKTLDQMATQSAKVLAYFYGARQ